MIYGYARVSTDGQRVAAQVRQLKDAECVKIFKEVASGARTDRTQLRKALGELEAGDVLMVTRLDRLARSTRDLLNILASISEKQAGFRSLSDAWADTTTAHGRLMLTVLDGLAEFERELIRARTGEGRARAIKRGVKMGRKPKLAQHQRQEALQRMNAGGNNAGDRQDVQCQPQHNFETGGMKTASGDRREGWRYRSVAHRCPTSDGCA